MKIKDLSVLFSGKQELKVFISPFKQQRPHSIKLQGLTLLKKKATTYSPTKQMQYHRRDEA